MFISNTFATRETMQTNGFYISREEVDTHGSQFLLLEDGKGNCILMRDQKGNDRFFCIDCRTVEKANEFLNRVKSNVLNYY